jgi:hypothetical protein
VKERAVTTDIRFSVYYRVDLQDPEQVVERDAQIDAILGQDEDGGGTNLQTGVRDKEYRLMSADRAMYAITELQELDWVVGHKLMEMRNDDAR